MSTPAQPLSGQQQPDTIQSFAGKIRAKFPDAMASDGRAYKDIPDDELVDKIVQKHPVYKARLTPEEFGKLPSVKAAMPGAGPEMVKQAQAGNLPPAAAPFTQPTQFEQERNPANQPGFLNSFWTNLKNLTVPGPGGVSSPYPGVTSESGQMAWKQAQEHAQSPEFQGRSPVYKAAVGAVGPLVNAPAMEQAAEVGNTKGVLGAAAAPAALAVAPLAAEGAKSIAKPLLSAGGRFVEKPVQALKFTGARVAEPFTATGERMVKQGVSPYAKQLGFDKALNTLGDDIARYHRETPIKSNVDFHEALPEIQKEIMEKEIRPTARAHADEALSPERWAHIDEQVADAVHPFQRKIEGGGVPTAAQEVLDKIHKAKTIGDVIGVEKGDRGGALGWLNGQLESYFKKYPSARGADLMKNPDTAALEGARQALRQEALDHLEQEGETGIRGARERWGAAEELRRATERRINQADRLKPIGIGKMIGLAAAPKTMGLTYLLGAIGDWLNKPDTLVARGIEKMAKTRAAKPISIEAGNAPKGELPPPSSKPPNRPSPAIPITRKPKIGEGAAAARMIAEPPKQASAASRAALVEDMQKAAANGTPEEKAAAKQRLKEMGESEGIEKFREKKKARPLT